MTKRSTVDVIQAVLTARCSEELATRCAAQIEYEIEDIDMNPIYMDCKIQFKVGQDEYPIVEEFLRDNPEKDDIMKEIKTRVKALLNQNSVLQDTRVQLGDTTIEALLNAGFKSL